MRSEERRVGSADVCSSDLNVRLVMSHKWQRDLGLRKKEFEGDWKKELLRLAKIEADRYEIDGKLSLKTCDALLLLMWRLRVERK